MAPRRPGYLLRLVAGVQALGLAVLHLNVATAPDATALYTLSLKVLIYGDVLVDRLNMHIEECGDQGAMRTHYGHEQDLNSYRTL
uniref:Secreted protein n=1 Tax=Zea mays TaxID=4577 RepID=A0A804MI60_MAIZE